MVQRRRPRRQALSLVMRSMRGRGRRRPTRQGAGSSARSRTAQRGEQAATVGRSGSMVQTTTSSSGNPAALQFTGSMTVSAWVNSAAFPVDDAAIVSKRANGEVGYQLDTTVDRGPRTVGFKLTNSAGGTMVRYGATTLLANTWYHVSGVYNAATSELHVYVNGQLDDGTLLGTVTSTQRNSTVNVNIGRRPTGNSFNFNGRLDDVRVYGRALTLAEIQADMNTAVV